MKHSSMNHSSINGCHAAPWLLIVFAVFAVFSSCKHDTLLTYEENNSVYFPHTNKVDSAVVDLTSGAFAYKEDSLLRIPVQLMGKVTPYDRPIDYRVDTAASTAREGTDIECLPSYIEAGKAAGYVRVRLINTTALQTNGDTLLARICLLPNDELRTEYNMHDLNRDAKDNLQFRVFLTSTLGGKPRLWRDENVSLLLNLSLGGNAYADIFSKQLYRLLLTVCEIPEELFFYTDEEWAAQTEPKGINLFAARFGGLGVIGMWKNMLITYLSNHPDEGRYENHKIIVY
jgi:hypothetical protein